MNYIKNTLLDNEKIVYSIGPHWIVFAPAVASWVILFLFFLAGDSLFGNFSVFNFNVFGLFELGLFLIAIFQSGLAYLRYKTSEYGITNQRIIIKVGFVSRGTLEVMLKRVESIQVDQTVLGRILNYGQVVIRGTGGSRDGFNFVPSPLLFRKMAQQEIARSQG